MKKILKRTLATVLIVLMLLTSAPLQGFVELEWPELSLPSVGQWFSGKASAADEKLTAEEAVDIFMKYIFNWDASDYELNYSLAAEYMFLDLDFDGILEMVTSYMSGSGRFSENRYYKIDIENKKIKYITIPEDDVAYYDGMDFYMDNLELYRDKNTSQLVYIGESLVGLGYEGTHKGESMLNYKSGIITETTLNFAYRISRSGYKTYLVYDNGWKTVSESTYNSVRDGFYSQYEPLNLKRKMISAKSFANSGSVVKRSLLLESYKAFCYDGMFEMNFTESEKEAYLGYPTDNIRDENDLHLIYKPANGDISKFDKSKVEFIVEDKSIAEIKNITSLSLLKDSVDIYADICSKKIGETKVIAKYDGVEVAECKLIVKQPNELKFSIAEPVNYYEADRVFFDESGTITSGAIKIPFKLENNFVKDVEYLINNPDTLKALKYKNIRVSFEIEGSDVLSFSSSEMLNKIDYHLESLDFKDSVEDLLYLYSYNSDGFSKNETENIKLKYNIYFDGPSDSESKNYNPENEETREIKLKNETVFTLQSYLNKYITEVVSAPSTYGYYKRLMDYSVAQDMKSLENTGDYKWAEVMSKGLVDNAVSLFTDFNEINGYEIVLADMLSILNSQNEAEQTQMFGGAVFDFSSSFFDALNGFFGEKYVNSLFSKLSGKEAKLTIDAITEVIAGKTTSGVAYELVTELMKDSRFVRFLDNTVFICDVANKALTAYGVVKDTVGGLQKALAVHSAYTAYEQSVKNNKYVFSRLRTAAENSGNDALAKAIYNYMNYEDSKISEKIANVIAETVVNGGGSGIQVGLIALANALAEGVAEKVFYVLGAVVAGFDCGRLLSNVLCNTSDYAAAAGSVVAAGYISENLKEAIFDIQSDVANDPGLLRSFEKAQQLDSALNMYRVIEEISYDKTIEAIEAEGTSKAGALVRRLSKKRQETYEETIATMLSGKKSLDSLKTHDEKLEEIYSKVLELGYSWKSIGNEDIFNTAFKTLCVQCPVDVFVRNSKGEIVASVENNTVTKENGGIDIIVIEDEKFICLPSTEEYDIEVIATDEGTMDYTVFEYGSDSLSNIRSVSYEKIPLVKNKEFTAKLNTAKYTDKDNYNLSVGTETITATKDDYVPVTSVSLDGDADTLYAGSEITLSVITDPENASPASFIWKSSDESVAAVSGGVVRGVKAGNAVITCELKSDSSIKASFEVTVTECSHSYSVWETVEESTCSEYGCKKRVCSVCNAVETEKITELKPHEAESESYELPASCEKNAATVTLCKNCGEICQRSEKQGTATGHKLSAVAVDKKATTENSGSQSQKCSTCGERVNVTKIPRVIKPYLSQTSFVFDGKVKNPALMVYDYDGNKLAVNTDYRLTVDSGRVKPGTYKVVVSFIGKYEGTEKLSFTIAMKKTTVKATQNTTAIRLDWSAVPGAAGYRVFYKTAAGWKALVTTNKLTATFDKLPAGTKYTFAVMAGAIVDGKVIWADNYTVIETATQTLAPKKIAAAQNANAIRLTWSKCPGATGYRIFYKSGNSWKICLNATTATSHTFTNLKAGTKFTFAVRPYIITDSGVIWSDYTTYTASTLPAIPKTAVTSPSSGKITVKWNAVSGAEAYQLYYKTGNGGYKLYKNYFSVQTVSFSGLKSGTKYTFAVRAAKNTSSGWVFGSFTPVSVTVK